MEIWKTVPSYVDYEVSNYGRVRSFKRDINGTIMKGTKNMKGYLRLDLCNKGNDIAITIHRLVMLAFVGPSDLTVNHIDGDKLNNHLSNLEYISNADNIKHAVKLGLHNNRGSRSGKAKLSEQDVLDIRKMLESNITQAEIARKFNVSETNIYHIKRGDTWSHLK